MKKRFLALSLSVATVIAILAVGVFAIPTLLSSNADNPEPASGPVIVAGYVEDTAHTININNALDSTENWVLPGRLANSETKEVTGTFGAQWNKNYLYLAIQRSSALDTISLKLNDKVTVDTSSYTTEIVELEITMSSLGIGAINGYNVEVPISISLSSGGSFSGYLKLSSVQWWKTSNVSNPISVGTFTETSMRGSVETEFDAALADGKITNIGGSSITKAETVGGNTITNGLHLWDRYDSAEGAANYLGGRTYASYGGVSSHEKTIYFSFDFYAESMPVYELGESLGNHHSTNYPNFGFSWRMADPYDSTRASNITTGGIINTADGLYLNICGKYFHTLKLGKKVGETFNVGLAWHSNGDLTVYIDGVKKGYYTDATKYMYEESSGNVRLICWRNELERVPGDDFDLYITNLAFGYALPDEPVKTLEFEDIQGENTSAEAVTSKLVLPTTLNNEVFSGETITWESSNPNVISDAGVVTRPATGAEKVTLTASDAADNQKSIDVVVIGTTYSSTNVYVVEGDKYPKTGAVDFENAYSGGVFHFDSNNNSLVYDQGEVKKVNVIKLTDLDATSRLTRETISIWTSNDNKTYTRVNGNYKLFHNGNDWYLYNFEVEAQYIKVHYTLYDQVDPDVTVEPMVYDTPDSDFTNVLSNIMEVSHEDVFGANSGTFFEKTVPVTNYSGKKQQDYAWCISASGLGMDDLTGLKFRVMLNGEYLYHYVSDDYLYVRIPDVEKDASVTLTVLYSNGENVLDISDKESVYEVTYGTKEMITTAERNHMYMLEVGTPLHNGTTLDQDVLIKNRAGYFDISYDGGESWTLGTKENGQIYDLPGYRPGNTSGSFAFYNGRLYWSAIANSVKTTQDEAGNKTEIIEYAGTFVTYSDDGGKTWTKTQVIAPPKIDSTVLSVSSYANGIAPSWADGASGNGIDVIFAQAGELRDGDMANVFLVCRNAGKAEDESGAITEQWAYAVNSNGEIIYLFMETEQGTEGGFSEATILENEAHELVWYCRWQTNNKNTFAISVSTDKALTWSEPKESTVYASCTQPILKEIDGDPLLVWGGNNAFGAHTYNRGPLSVAVSYDGLYTFRNIQNVFAETFLEDYTQIKYGGFVTNPSVERFGNDLLISFYSGKKYKQITRITDYENWFYRTKGIYDSFESQNAQYEGWVNYMGGTSISDKKATDKTYSLEIAPHAVVSRSVPYLQNGTVSMNVFVDGTSTFTIELQSAFTPVMNKCAPVSLKVVGNELYYAVDNGLHVDYVNTDLELVSGWNSVSINLGLAKKTPTAAVSVDDGMAVPVTVNTSAGDYACYIVVNTGDESVYIDEVLVQSNLDAINYNGEIQEVDAAIVSSPADQHKGIGETATFRVAAQGYGLMYQWYRNDELIVGATSAAYTTDVLTAEDSGSQYKCVVKDRNENEVVSEVATLTVDHISVSISWGSMAFNYYSKCDNDCVEGCERAEHWAVIEDGANEIVITNNSAVALQATVTYQQEENHEAIRGSFDEDETPETATEHLAAENGTITWTLSLVGRGSEELNETAVGRVIICLQKVS